MRIGKFTTSQDIQTFIFALILTIFIFGVGCTSRQLIDYQTKPLGEVYSGWWKDITKDLEIGTAILRTVNCEVRINDTLIEMRPTSPGKCAIFTSKANQRDLKVWSVFQLPEPTIFLAKPHKDLYVDMENPINYFLDAQLWDIDNSVYFDPNRKMYSYVNPLKFRVEGFLLKIYNNKDSLVYESAQYGNLFSCEDFFAFKKYSKEQGTKVIISDVNVIYPDGSDRYFSMDTLKY